MSHPIPITHYKINSISPVYAYYNQYLYPNHEEEYSKNEIKYGKVNRYRIISIIGSGKYSIVFAGNCSKGFCAIKVLKNVVFQKVQKEIYLLQRLQGPNVVKLYDVIRDELTGTISIVTEYFHSESARKIYPIFSIEEIRYYIYMIIITMDSCHAKGVMHRDIKPGNVLINIRKNQISIIDWGLADLYYPMKQYSVRVSTMRYKAPELLLNYHFYDYAVDVWGIGCIMAEMMFGIGFIKGSIYEEVLASITKLWGKDEIHKYIDKYGLEVPDTYWPYIDQYDKPTWDEAIEMIREDIRDDLAIDLMKKLLTVDHGERITCRDALHHPFFDVYYK
ncbi:Casein kinase II subunit alpha [Tritrichomonas foetus]|uniref:non-specific serine/threonine protein kinase n=1 Tax=Tritrichomonas foetus TaxID=1144522 RepID=A0A1J4L1F6_9EUKA|nr:Casein kinase II subunit alpha [Tritrichomonas foetus]|eukprot:OHT15796.1 Casein kinase II subunit alpha [Tritrichomonas foetus]